MFFTSPELTGRTVGVLRTKSFKSSQTEVFRVAEVKEIWSLYGNPLQYSCLENPMDRGVCWATVHRVAELDTTEATNTHTRVRTHTHVRTSCEMPGWMNHKLESKLPGDTTLKAESKEELNS